MYTSCSLYTVYTVFPAYTQIKHWQVCLLVHSAEISKGIFHCTFCSNYRDRLCADHRIFFFPFKLQKQALEQFMVWVSGSLRLWFFTLSICPIQQRDGRQWFKRKTTHKEVPQLESTAKVQQFKKGLDTNATILLVYVRANCSYSE